MKRRHFLKFSAAMGLSPKKRLLPLTSDLYAFSNTSNLSQVEAKYYQKLADREIECRLCPRFCKLGDKERGYCGVRENRGGTYYTLVYGKACAVHVDPIEKKPLFHFLPQTGALSIASAGCNVNCKFCQNWEISQVRPEQITHIDLPPESVVRSAQKNNCPSIAYTYSEPVVFYEYMYDTCVKARNKGIKNVMVTGAHINPEPFEDLLKVLDGVKIDLKAFDQDFYTKYVRGELQPVLDAIVTASQSQAWLEIVYLVIPTLNDKVSEIRRMCQWIQKEIGPDIPLHFSRFYPSYLMKNLPPTPISTMEKLKHTAQQQGLHYVYIGNIPGHEGENTICPQCKNTIVKRLGYLIENIHITDGRCDFCGLQIPGLWS
ncbi:MAG: AmmeMemoRadiSam system radical SAM enzyme [Candidatus Aminicenantes bacterium]|nr:AmmeMemoRadiSam system radical SAM enzyme [Candidatus Aminicenantes bacterium]